MAKFHNDKEEMSLVNEMKAAILEGMTWEQYGEIEDKATESSDYNEEERLFEKQNKIHNYYKYWGDWRKTIQSGEVIRWNKKNDEKELVKSAWKIKWLHWCYAFIH